MPSKYSYQKMRKALDLARELRRRDFRADDNIYATFNDVGESEAARDTFLRNLMTWLKDRHASVAGDRGRGHYLFLIAGRQFHAYEAVKSGKSARYEHQGSYTLHPDYRYYDSPVADEKGNVTLARNAIGAYGTFERKGDNRPIFRDLRTASHKKEFQPWVIKGTDEEANSDDLVVPRLTDKYGEKFMKFFVASMGKKQGILYLFPRSDNHRVFCNYVGASGFLENYGSDPRVRERTHLRNLEVLDATARAFREYQRAYIRLVKSTKSGRHLYSLGPPPEPFVFEMPIGVNSDEQQDINDATNSSNYDSWDAVSHQLDRLSNIRSPGSIFLKVSFEAATKVQNGPLEATAKVTSNLELDGDGFKASTNTYTETAVGTDAIMGGKLPKGVELKLVESTNSKTGETVFGAELGKEKGLKYACSSDGSFSFTGGHGQYASWNPRDAEGGLGMCAKGSDLLPKSVQKKLAIDAPGWLGKALESKFCGGLHFILGREEAYQAWAVGAPGFFERRPIDDILASNWRSLYNFERAQLITIGWTQKTFDRRKLTDFPPSTKEPFAKLTPAQRSAAARLGMTPWLPKWAAMRKNIKNLEETLVHGR